MESDLLSVLYDGSDQQRMVIVESGYRPHKSKHMKQSLWIPAIRDNVVDFLPDDAVDWLTHKKSYADPDRIWLVGGSYGGYAALMVAAKTPDL